MLYYMHDLWLNWIEGAVKGYEVPDFHEWRRDDGVDLMDQIPYIKVKEGFFDYIEDGLNEIPEDLLATVKGKAYRRRNDRRIKCDAFVITDGKRILAVDTCDADTPVKKSRLIPRQEQLLLELTKGNEPIKFEYTPLPEAEDDPTVAPNETMIGLTRTEREKKRLLFESLILGYNETNINKIRYWYSEWDYKSMDSIKQESVQSLLMRLIVETAIGWHDGHEELLKVSVVGNPYLEIIYSGIKEREKSNGTKKMG